MSDSSADHDLLLKLNQKLDMLYEEFRRVSNGHGFPRCAERLARLNGHDDAIETIHKRIDGINSKLWWAVTTSVTTGLGLIVSLILYFVKGHQ